MQRILTATGQDVIDNTVRKFSGYEVVAVAKNRKEIIDKIRESSPDILLVAETLFGDVPLNMILLNVNKEFPNVRIVYLAGGVDLRNERTLFYLSTLAMVGIYDIYHEKKITAQGLKYLLDHPKTEKDVEHLIQKSSVKHKTKDVWIDFDNPEEVEEDSFVQKNLFTFSSIKPGTGKSFVSVNVAGAIAKYGKKNAKNERPKVALIEADLQNLSLGTLLNMESEKKNLKLVMDKIATVINKDGKIIAPKTTIDEVNDYIINSFLPYSECKNLYGLVGSQLGYDEILDFDSAYYLYLVDVIGDYFDVIIVDTNSSMNHITTIPLLMKAKACYYILNLDFNNIRNNVRYVKTLEEIGISEKIKYILNQDIPQTNGETLMFNSKSLEELGFKLEAKIPDIPSAVFFNRIAKGVPIIFDNNYPEINSEIIKIANQIYPTELMS